MRIPFLYNGRNKLFFFAGYQFEKSDSTAATTSAYVPTAANLLGDFSTTDPAPTSSGGTGVATTCSGVEQLYDPVTGALLPDNKYASAPTFNSAALKLLGYLPKVSPLVDGSDACGHVAYAIPQLLNDKQFVTRVDYTISLPPRTLPTTSCSPRNPATSSACRTLPSARTGASLPAR